MNMVTDMDKFTKFQTATAIGNTNNALSDATQNAVMMGMVMNHLQQQQNTQPPQDDITQKLQKLKTLFESNLIDEVEYKAKKAELIDKM